MTNKIGCVQHDCDECKDLRAKLADAEELQTIAYMKGKFAGRKDAEAKLASAEPVAWMRFCSDGGYEGPIADGDKRMSDVRKKSGSWTPLYTTPQPAPDVQAAVECGQMMQDMVDRFLSWKLPKDFNPDGGISFNPTDFQKANDYAWPTGTNLFTAAQAEDMVGFIGAKVIAGAIMAKNEWTSFKPYLKDGETPIMRLEREIADCQAVLSLLKAEKEKTQASVSVAMEWAEEIVEGWAVSAENFGFDGDAENYRSIKDEIRAIPRDSSALDEYKADIKRLVALLGASTAWLNAEGVYQNIVSLNEAALYELKAKYNL